MELKNLIEFAIEAKEKSTYTPYSNFRVGAAVEMEDGSIYTGGNIEIASYSPTNCAERTAIFKAISEGKREIKKNSHNRGRKGHISMWSVQTSY